MTTLPTAPGQVFAGKYQVERVLGRGGMGVVFAANHLGLHRKVAIKLLLPELATNRELVARFLREARAAVSIDSAHVAQVFDVGTTDEGVPYMVMEYLQGADLAEELRRRGPLPVRESVGFLLQAIEAIAIAHKLGIVHRDLKPANLYLAHQSDGTAKVKVLDFGISKLTQPLQTGQASLALTGTTSVLGSPLYMSPEQMRSASTVTAATDIWSLGVILFELLTGRPPFRGTQITELWAAVLSEPAPQLRAIRADVPPGVEQAVSRCLEKNPAARFQSVAELALALVEFGPRAAAQQSLDRIMRTVGGSTTGGWQDAGGVASTNVAIASTPPPAPRKRYMLPIMVAAGALIVGGAGLAFGLASWRSAPEPLSASADSSQVARTSSADRMITVLPPEAEARDSGFAAASTPPVRTNPGALPTPQPTAPRTAAPATTPTGKKNPLNVDIK